ncbi:helix-turn-helix transcriptional regulator [Streptomyces sp. XD-27]|uniref:helix-turn-helix domain-containing protein n=1 Tax=Streptomyces sp. XD-27 TaxID=3062779 RepID=UPI0026F452FA|nr:helix-turn-helix transcriptional regulator [Streptomyces sp. XD-27]WKX70924.1 helix-turn-helix transcriptional regulator [Streptomyces sp. XD-27]
MPARDQPTARQARLGAELRKLREAAGMSSAEAAASLGWERPRVSHIESGRHGVSGERVRHLASHYSARDTAYIDALAAMADERSTGWWKEFRDILTASALDLAELEHHARYVRVIELLIVPGLLQTEDYARAVFDRAITQRPAAAVDAAVRHRMARRRILERSSPTDLEVFLHESALHMRYGSRSVMRAQIEFLCEAADWPTASIRLIPFEAEGITSSIQSLTYAGGPVPQLDTVQVDNAFDGAFLDADAQLGKYRALIEHVEKISLSAGDSKKLMRAAAREL